MIFKLLSISTCSHIRIRVPDAIRISQICDKKCLSSHCRELYSILCFQGILFNFSTLHTCNYGLSALMREIHVHLKKGQHI